MLLADIASAFPQDSENAVFWEADGVHFSSEGYEAVGSFLADLLLTSLDTIRNAVDDSPAAFEAAMPSDHGDDLV